MPQALTEKHPNIHLMSTRRLVQWGAWTMVVTMLDAMKSLMERALDFDFFVNLSDVDVRRAHTHSHARHSPPNAHAARCAALRLHGVAARAHL